MSLTLKLASLFIRTLAKPVANSIKSRAREHETFRKTFIRFAQSLHRVDMRMRLGILHDAAAQERMHAREAAEAASKAAQKKAPTVRTEAEQAKFEAGVPDDAAAKKKEEKPKIRPLSESRAIDLGANFASESFIFAVAAGLLVFERWWSRRKENAKDEHVVERIAALEERAGRVSDLEKEILRLRGQAVPEVEEKKVEAKQAPESTSSGGEKQTQVVAAS